MNHFNLPSWAEVCKEFQRIWGYDDFRFPQGEIVQSLLIGQDALVIMPTGGGKSICFQLPALLKGGLTIVISPLIALMENQVQELRNLNLAAGVIHSQMPREQRQRILAALTHNKLRLLYISPETLFNETLWNVISQPDIQINGLIVDEAHCLVQWGETFRPAYRRLGTVRRALLKEKPPGTIIPIAAFTATADPTAQTVITQVLELQEPECFLVNPYRDNLVLKTQTVCTPKRRQQEVLKFLKQHSGETGLIYVRTRQDSEELATFLQELDYQTLPYHAGLDSAERRGIEQLWLNDRIKFVICTSAFGMGVNKANVRWVLHFQAPLLLSEYVQEVGRAGRDGQLATALTLVSEPTGLLDTGDRQRWRYFLNTARSQFQKAEQLIHRIPPTGEIEDVVKSYPDGAIALAILHARGQLTWLDPFRYQLNLSVKVPNTDHYRQGAEQMRQYLKSRSCRWRFILLAFGFPPPNTSWRCGHCDRCRGKK